MRRYALRDDQWDRFKDFLPGREGHVGGTAVDNRLFVEAVLMIDATIVRAHQHSAGARKKNGEQAIGRSRGGLTTKIHVLVDALGNPVRAL